MAILAVGAGGFLGACLRYGISQLFLKQGESFPVGTLVANVAAGLLIGFIIGLDRGGGVFSPGAKLFLTTGMLGGLSTFSTFSLETVDLLAAKRYLSALGYVLLSLGLSLAGVVAGSGGAAGAQDMRLAGMPAGRKPGPACHRHGNPCGAATITRLNGKRLWIPPQPFLYSVAQYSERVPAPTW